MATSRADLEKLTAPKLREFALAQFPSLTGVSGMKKEDLMAAIIAEEVRQGLRPKEDAKTQATATMGTGQLKSAIRAMKTRRASAPGDRPARCSTTTSWPSTPSATARTASC